jgi:hypothetical protein
MRLDKNVESKDRARIYGADPQKSQIYLFRHYRNLKRVDNK